MYWNLEGYDALTGLLVYLLVVATNEFPFFKNITGQYYLWKKYYFNFDKI